MTGLYILYLNLIIRAKGFNFNSLSSATITDGNQHNVEISLLDRGLLKRFATITLSTFPKKKNLAVHMVFF